MLHPRPSALLVLASLAVAASASAQPAPVAAPPAGAPPSDGPRDSSSESPPFPPSGTPSTDSPPSENAASVAPVVPASTHLPVTPQSPPPALAAKTAATTTTETDQRFIESNVISLADRQGFRWETRSGDFLFNPYTLVQTFFQYKHVDDEGLDLADPDNVVDLGFGTNAAILGIAGKGFGIATFNLTLNAACAGRPCLLNQAWMDVNALDELRFRVGKFKTPMHWTQLVRIGQTLMPRGPTSLYTRVNLPFDINAVNPTFATGFDTGVMVHGLLGKTVQYQVGVFNGEGIDQNAPTSTLNDDNSWPALLYSARLAVMPLGRVAPREGGPGDDELAMLVAASSSYNIESNAESSNDFRAGLELAVSAHGLTWGLEPYILHMDFVERQREAPSALFWGAYTQLGYLLPYQLEPVARFEVMDRNSTDNDGILLMPTVGLNYYIHEQNLKVQAMYQHLLRSGHEDDFAANDDDNGMAERWFVLQLQFAL